MSLHTSPQTTDQEKILFAASYMKEGMANDWAQNQLQSILEKKEVGKTFEQFLQELEQAFGEINQGIGAQDQIAQLRWDSR